MKSVRHHEHGELFLNSGCFYLSPAFSIQIKSLDTCYHFLKYLKKIVFFPKIFFFLTFKKISHHSFSLQDVSFNVIWMSWEEVRQEWSVIRRLIKKDDRQSGDVELDGWKKINKKCLKHVGWTGILRRTSSFLPARLSDLLPFAMVACCMTLRGQLDWLALLEGSQQRVL